MPTIDARVSNAEIANLCRQLGALIRAKGLTVQVFEILAADVVDPKARTLVLRLRDAVSAGSAHSEACQSAGDPFDSFFCSIHKEGEQSGRQTLCDTLLQLAIFYESRTTSAPDGPALSVSGP